MKKAYPIASPESSVSIMGFYGNFEEDLKKIKALGYDGIELLVKNPDEMNMELVYETIKKNGLNVAAIGTNPIFKEDKLYLMDNNENVRIQAVERTKRLVDLAEKLDKACVCIGKYRGNIMSCGMEESMSILADELKDIAAYADKKGVKIMIEPQSESNIDNIFTAEDAVKIIERTGCKNIGILYDFFHGNLAEKDMYEAIEKYGKYFGFIHCSDSERKIPSEGAININKAFEVLYKTGYSDYVSLEIEQGQDTFETAKKSIEVLKNAEKSIS